MIDKYFKKPVFWDYLFGISFTGIIIFILKRVGFSTPKDETILSIVSDLSTVALTLSGFILTLLTVLISFKSTAKSKKDIKLEADSLYEIFYSTNLYFETARHLKNAIISLTFIAIVGYTLKLTLDTCYYFYLFSFNLLSLLIIFFTLWRCLLILSKIIKIQKEQEDVE
jgi:hypothetical protein